MTLFRCAYCPAQVEAEEKPLGWREDLWVKGSYVCETCIAFENEVKAEERGYDEQDF